MCQNQLLYNLGLLKSKDIPESYPKMGNKTTPNEMSELIEILEDIHTFSCFPLLAKDWLKDLAAILKGRRVLEVMAGTGALARGLRDFGVNIIATDNGDWNNSFAGFWTNVEQIDALSAIEKYENNINTIICSWPPQEEEIGSLVLNRIVKIKKPILFVYLGEWRDSCADDEFFDILTWDFRLLKEKTEFANRNFHNLGDYGDSIFIYKTKLCR